MLDHVFNKEWFKALLCNNGSSQVFLRPTFAEIFYRQILNLFCKNKLTARQQPRTDPSTISFSQRRLKLI